MTTVKTETSTLTLSHPKVSKRGMIFCFEGIDGCGKSTQVVWLRDYLSMRGFTVTVIAFPSRDGVVGTRIRDFIEGRAAFDRDGIREFQYLCIADRFSKQREIRERVERGEFVILDRYLMSGCAYTYARVCIEAGRENDIEGARHFCGFENIKRTEEQSVISPDITILLDISAEDAVKRISARRGVAGVEEKLAFLRVVARAYEFCAREFRDRVARVDGSQNAQTIAEFIRSIFMSITAP